MNKLLLSGVISNVKAFDGKVKFCFARIKGSMGGSYSISAFGETVDKLIAASDKFCLVEGHVRNSKQKDGTFKFEAVCSSVEVISDKPAECQAVESHDQTDIPF